MCVVSDAPASTRAVGGAPHVATKRVRGVPTWAWSVMRPRPLGPSVEPPYGATKRVRGVPKWA
eukprot:578437-Pyramimonas_sp.AAC.1